MRAVTVEGWVVGVVVGLVVGGLVAWLVRSRLGWADRDEVVARLRRTADALDEIVETAPAGFVVFDRDRRIVRINPALARIVGLDAREQVVGGFAFDVFGTDAGGDVDAAIRKVLETRTSVANLRLEVALASTGAQRALLVSCYPVELEELMLVGVVAIDVTERERYDREREGLLASESEARARAEQAASRLSRLQAITSALSTAPSSELVAEVITAEGMKAMEIDAGALAVITQHLRTLRIEPTESWRVATQEADAEISFDAHHPIAEAVRTQRAAYFDSLDDLARVHPELAATARRVGWSSFAVLPLVVSGRILGALGAAFTERRGFDAERTAFFEAVADQCAAALDRAFTYDATQVLARTLQRSLLPPALPTIADIELAARFEPAGNGEVSGDFYDAFGIPGGTLCATIGDVCGKGVDAATMTSLARHTIRAVAHHDHRPSAVLTELNEALRRDIEERGADGGDDSFCTAAFAFLRPMTNGLAVELSCGGHPLPLIVRAGGRVEECGLPGTFLGALPASDLTLPDQVVVLEPGDALMLYTDGVTEASGEDGFFGEDRLQRALARPPTGAVGLVAHAVDEVMAFTGGLLRDDLAILVVRVPERYGGVAGVDHG